MFEKETVEFYNKLIREQRGEKWRHSPVVQAMIKRYAERYRDGTFSEEIKPEQTPRRHRFYRKKIKKLFPETRSILEIGGHYGGLCSLMLDEGIEEYYFVDLPEILPLAFWYLKNEEKAPTFIAPWELPGLNARIDLFVNTMSFNHMNRDNLEYYFNEINRLKPKYLFLVNRNWKRDPTDVIMDDYPISKDYKLIKEEKLPWLVFPHHNHLIRVYKNTKIN